MSTELQLPSDGGLTPGAPAFDELWRERFGRRRRARARMALIWRTALAVIDLAAVVSAGLLTSVVLGGRLRISMASAVATIALLVAGSAIFGLHARKDVHLATSTLNDVPRLLQWSLVGTAIFVLVADRLSAAAAVTLATGLFTFAWLGRLVAAAAWRRLAPRERVLLIGSGQFSGRFARKLALEPTLNADVVAHVGGSRPLDSLAAEDLAAELTQLVSQLHCERIVVGADDLDGRQLRAVTEVGHAANLKISVMPTTGGAIGSQARLRHVAELPVLEFECRPIDSARLAAKRVFDIVAASVALVVTLPLFLVIAIAIRLQGRGPVFYLAARAGADAKPFRMFKFRTMTGDASERLQELIDIDALEFPMYKLDRDPRVTRVGEFLRKTSLDELPQLINVLRGDMSIVGPRPEDVRLVERYDQEALSIRCRLRPGITGPMQIHGRADLTFRERLDVEREYLENYSLGKDVSIIAVTVASLLSRRGAY